MGGSNSLQVIIIGPSIWTVTWLNSTSATVLWIRIDKLAASEVTDLIILLLWIECLRGFVSFHLFDFQGSCLGSSVAGAFDIQVVTILTNPPMFDQLCCLNSVCDSSRRLVGWDGIAGQKQGKETQLFFAQQKGEHNPRYSWEHTINERYL